MSPQVPFLARAVRVAASALVLALVLPRVVHAAGETWDVLGQTYTNVRVREVTAGTITIFHSGGVAQLELATLSPELQTRFGYDEEKASTEKSAAESARAATREAERRIADQRAKNAAPTIAAPSTSGAPARIPGRPVQVELHPEVDLRSDFRGFGLFLKDQGMRPSCSVFATLSAVEYETARRLGKAEPLSEEFLIWAVHELQPDIPLDNGYHFSEVVSALQMYGVPRQAVMPNTFGKKTADIHPSPDALFDASTRRNLEPIWFRADDPQLLERMVNTLNERSPVVVGLRWPHWSSLARNNLLRDQKPLAGPGHAVTLIGYRCPTGKPEDLVFVFRNSYGVSWGLGGCAFVAASYLRENVIAAFIITIPADGAASVAR